MEKDTPLDILIDKYLAGKATSDEKALLERAYEQAVGHLSIDEQYATEINRIGRETWVELAARIAQPARNRTVSWKKWTAVAASLLVAAAMCVWKYSADIKKQPVSHQSVFVNDVNPGSKGATLMLGSGQRINLVEAAQGDLVQEAGMRISKTEDGLITYELVKQTDLAETWNTLTTDSGQTFRVRLPDGSMITLNAASSLKYAVTLGHGSSRNVYLTGEGYFDIVPNPSNPFLVDVHGQQTEVLGTRFTINSYAGEPDIRTVLLEGAIKVTMQGNDHLLQPGQQAINNGVTIRVDQADIEQATDWINGEFALNGLNFRTAMRKIARWYQVEVILDQSVPDDLETGGWISRDTKLSEVLGLIEKTGQVYFHVENRKVYVFKK